MRFLRNEVFMNKTPTTLIIMDGFGLRRETAGNAIAAANTPRLDQFFQEYAHTELSASGLDVGLPAGQMSWNTVQNTTSSFRSRKMTATAVTAISGTSAMKVLSSRIRPWLRTTTTCSYSA